MRLNGNSGAVPAAELRARLARAAASLTFGEVAVAVGLKGSSRAGWTCPACGTEHSVRERTDHIGGRCTMKVCAKGYDLAGLAMTARGISVLQAAALLDRLVEEKAARGNPKAPGLLKGLFGGEE